MFCLSFRLYQSHITTTAYTIQVLPGFHQAAALKYLAQGHSHDKTQKIQCSSNPRPLDYESNTLPMSNVRHCGNGRNTTKQRFLLFQHRLLPFLSLWTAVQFKISVYYTVFIRDQRPYL